MTLRRLEPRIKGGSMYPMERSYSGRYTDYDEAKRLEEIARDWTEATGCESPDEYRELLAPLHKERYQLRKRVEDLESALHKQTAHAEAIEWERGKVIKERNVLREALWYCDGKTTEDHRFVAKILAKLTPAQVKACGWWDKLEHQHCGNCKHSDKSKTPPCQWNIAGLPTSFRVTTAHDDGHDCPCWERKGSK